MTNSEIEKIRKKINKSLIDILLRILLLPTNPFINPKSYARKFYIATLKIRLLSTKYLLEFYK